MGISLILGEVPNSWRGPKFLARSLILGEVPNSRRRPKFLAISQILGDFPGIRVGIRVAVVRVALCGCRRAARRKPPGARRHEAGCHDGVCCQRTWVMQPRRVPPACGLLACCWLRCGLRITRFLILADGVVCRCVWHDGLLRPCSTSSERPFFTACAVHHRVRAVCEQKGSKPSPPPLLRCARCVASPSLPSSRTGRRDGRRNGTMAPRMRVRALGSRTCRALRRRRLRRPSTFTAQPFFRLAVCPARPTRPARPNPSGPPVCLPVGPRPPAPPTTGSHAPASTYAEKVGSSSFSD